MEFETRPSNDESEDGPDYPTRRRKSTSEIMFIYRIQELESSIHMHRNIQIKFDPVANCQYWLRERCIQDCWMKIFHAQIDLKYSIRQRFIKNSLDTLESYLKGTDVIDRTSYQITNVVLEKAAADLNGRDPPFGEEELQRTRFEFYELLRANYNSSATTAHCAVTHLFALPSVIRPTHIFPFWVGEHIMKLIFGTNFDNDTLSTNNGLVVHESVAIALANLWIVIVPSGRPRSGRWKTRVIKKGLLNRYMGAYNRRWQTIDNMELEFQGSFRPSERYLYWHYATARIHASARQPANFWADLLGQDCWKPHEPYIRLDYLDAYIERRRDFQLEKFEDLRKYAIRAWSPGTCLDVRIAAKFMNNVMDRQHEMVIWRNAGPMVDQEDGYNGDIGGYGADLDDSGQSGKDFGSNGRPAHVIGPKVTRPRPESPHTGPANQELLSTSSEGELEDARGDSNIAQNVKIASADAVNQASPDVLQEEQFPLGAI